jgi:hypothetical protein
MEQSDYERRMRRIDWMLTAHSILRDRYKKRSQALTLAVIALSITGLVFALANGEQDLDLLGHQIKLQNFLAVLAALIFLIGLTDLVVEWRRQGWEHGEAARHLGQLKALYARAQSKEEIGGIDLIEAYDETMAELVRVPDREAASLKAKHARKVALFKAIEEHPGAPRWWLTIFVTRSAMRKRPAKARSGDQQ